jgi:hypothetical protein
MYNENGVPEEKDLNLQIMSFMVVKFNYEADCYNQYSIRMSLKNAMRLCAKKRSDDPTGDYKVHGELDF